MNKILDELIMFDHVANHGSFEDVMSAIDDHFGDKAEDVKTLMAKMNADLCSWLQDYGY